ncbi:MAG: Asp/Glu racemase [Pseudomonadota bacterium]
MALPYALSPAPAASLGLIVLEADETLENEARRALPDDVSLHHTRIPSAPEVTPETLAAMKAELPRVAASFPGHVKYDVIGYGCTSGATVIGQDAVASAIQSVHSGVLTTDPISAVMAACDALGARRIGLLTPYEPPVSAAMRDLLEAKGYQIASFASFEQKEEATVARIDEASTLGGMLEVGEKAEVVFASCTNVRTFNVIEEAERQLGKPVISSNSALIWRMARLARAEAAIPGRLSSA